MGWLLSTGGSFATLLVSRLLLPLPQAKGICIYPRSRREFQIIEVQAGQNV